MDDDRLGCNAFRGSADAVAESEHREVSANRLDEFKALVAANPVRHHDLLCVHVVEPVALHLGGGPLDGATERLRAAQTVADAVCEPSQPTVRSVVRERRADDARGALAVLFFAAPLWNQALTFVEPHLDPDLAVGSVRFGEAVVDVGAQRLQRQLAVQIPLRPRDFSAVQTSRDAHLDAARAEAQRRLHRLAHRAAKRNALLELHRDRFGNQLRVELGLLDLLDVDEDLAVRALLDFLLQLVDFRPLAADDDAGARCVDVDLQAVDGALGLDLRDAGVREALLQALAQRQILVQQLRVIAVRVPSRPPRLVEPEPESERVNLLAHDYSFAFA